MDHRNKVDVHSLSIPSTTFMPWARAGYGYVTSRDCDYWMPGNLFSSPVVNQQFWHFYPRDVKYNEEKAMQ